MALHNIQFFKQIDAFDLSNDIMAHGIKEAERLALNINFFERDLNVNGISNDKYDVIYAHNALHHMPEIDHVMENVRRSLKAGGIFVILENDTDNELNQRMGDMILDSLDAKYRASREHLKHKSLCRRSPLEGVANDLKGSTEKYMDITFYQEFCAFTPWLFRYQYNWSKDDVELIENVVEIDKKMIEAGICKGNKKLIVAKK